ncbi:MAG: hypothetical protein Q9167_005451 [Letrouitia subvulpina]
MGWPFKDKYALHKELGGNFIIVTPGGSELVIADPEDAHTVLSRRKEYIKPAVMYEQLNVFGPNLNTAEGEDWQRHRRLTAPSFNEKISSLVWEEAMSQAHDMGSSWYQEGSLGTKSTIDDTATLALHVLTSAGFGVAYKFNHGVQLPSEGHAMSYRESLAHCLKNIITFAIIPKKYLSSRWLPYKLRILGKAVQEFQLYMEEALERERAMISKRKSGAGNLMSALIQASEETQASERPGARSDLSLSDREIFGNIFMYNLAGHETTANTVATALILLAAHPKCQEWLLEEIDMVFGRLSIVERKDYIMLFPKLRRCLAVMFETLRLYGSIPFIPKSTPSEPSVRLESQRRVYSIPPATFVSINVQALHTDPTTWGSDSLIWRPSRWMVQDPSSRVGVNEHLITPRTGTFIPWADGPRNCPGQKFAQVEFIAVIATLFSSYRVEPVLEDGQSLGIGQKNLLSMVEGSAISAITLQIQEPRKVALKWEKR